MEGLETILVAYLMGELLRGGKRGNPVKENLYLGTETPYTFESTVYTPPPKGYHPIYINHLGRHGGRYLAKDEGIEKIYELLEEARKQGTLTEQGEKLAKEITALMKVEESKYGFLTPSGIAMEEGIAKRMYEHFPKVFGRAVYAVSTEVKRTKQSMEAFLETLGQYTSPWLFHSQSNGTVDPVLRFFDLNKAYLCYKKEGRWKTSVAKFEKRKAVAKELLGQFFTAEYLETLEGQEEIAQTLYCIYTNQYDVGVNEGLGSFFQAPWRQYFWENSNLRNYLEKGPSYEGEDLPTDIAFGLLADFLVSTEQALKTKDTSANLRFAHAETIIPFASLLKLPGYSQQTDDMNRVQEIWKDNEVSPMAANIQWILYEGEGGQEPLMKVLYNEKETLLPLHSDLAPYYYWKDVRRFYTEILQSLNLDWDESLVALVTNYDN